MSTLSQMLAELVPSGVELAIEHSETAWIIRIRDYRGGARPLRTERSVSRQLADRAMSVDILRAEIVDAIGEVEATRRRLDRAIQG